MDTLWTCFYLSFKQADAPFNLPLDFFCPKEISISFFLVKKVKCLQEDLFQWLLIFARSRPCPVMPSPQFFDGQALVSWSDPDITVAVPWYMGLMFRTRQPAGTLMQANAGQSSTINLMVRRHSLSCGSLMNRSSSSAYGVSVTSVTLLGSQTSLTVSPSR